MVVLDTSLGQITVELFSEQAPVTVKNFLDYVDEKFFDGTIFHRVISGFVLQGGGMTETMEEKPTRSAIQNEADNSLRNERGTLSMARTNEIHSATSQFFINLADNAFLDHSGDNFGYAVFGKVTDGMDVVDKIAAVPTGNHGPHQDVPVEAVVIQKIRRV